MSPEDTKVTAADLSAAMDRYGYPPETRQIIQAENLLPTGLLGRLHATYPQHSGLVQRGEGWFSDRTHYAGISGFRQVVGVLAGHGIHLGDLTERELFVEVYRFKVSRHALNSIDWQDYEHDSMFQLMFPQPGMMRRDLLERYAAAASPEERSRIASDYVHDTNPHDAHQLLNKAWMSWRTTATSTWSRAASTSIRPACSSSTRPRRNASPSAPTASATPRCAATRTCSSRRTSTRCTPICASTPRSPTCSSPAATPATCPSSACGSTSSPSSKTRRCCTCAPSASARACSPTSPNGCSPTQYEPDAGPLRPHARQRPAA